MKRILSLSLVLMMVLSLFAMAPLTTYAAMEGDGTEQTPYIIMNAEDLAQIETGKYYKLGASFKVTAPITGKSGFTLDGAGETIELDITGTDTNGTALFQTLTGETTIKNLNLDGKVNSAFNSTAALIGKINAANSKINISNVKNYASVNSTGNNYASSFVGLISSANNHTLAITNCENHGNISGVNYVAGFVGCSGGESGTLTINSSYNYGDIKGTVNYAAGFITFWGGSSSSEQVNINNCGNYGKVTGDYIGGFVSATTGTAGTMKITIQKSFNAGQVEGTGATYAYGFAFVNQSSLQITDCFNTLDVICKHTTGYGVLVYKGNLTNVYNTGKVRQFIGTPTTLTNVYILDGSSVWGNNIIEDDATGDGIKEKTYDELKALAETLGEGFVTATPTKENAYPYPQIVGNPYVKAAATTPDTLGATGEAFPGADLGTATFADGEKTITGKYLAAFGIAPDKFGWEKSYGIEITTSEGVTYTAEAVKASATADGHYGVLFYGPALTEGTYTIKPYAVYEGYGEENKVYGEEKEVTVD